MGFWKWLRHFRKRKKPEISQGEPAEEKSFFLYIEHIPEVLAYFRRTKGISKKKLELVLIDNEGEAAWKILKLMENLMGELNLLYLVTSRPEVYEELADEVFTERGMLLICLEKTDDRNLPGNLILDLNEWENHLDIVTALRYNTLIRRENET
jgi:hypothetical protein